MMLTQRMLGLRCMTGSGGIKADLVFEEVWRSLPHSRMTGIDAVMNCGLGVG